MVKIHLRALVCFAFVMILSLASAANALEEVPPALVYPVERVYQLLSTNAEGMPSADDWAKASVGEGFFAKGAIEPEGARTVFRMLQGKDRLYVRIDCASRSKEEEKESIEFYVTQSGKPQFPIVAVTLNEDGQGVVGLAERAHTWWTLPQIWPLDETVIPRSVTTSETGWTAEFSLPFDELKIPRDGARFNVVHCLSDGERYAWADLGGRRGASNQFDTYAITASVQKVEPAANALRLPAQLQVGLNRLSLEKAAPAARLRIGNSIITPKDGAFEVIVRDRGPLDMTLLDDAGNPISKYHADVRRPLIIDIPERYLAADATTFDVDIALRIASETLTKIVLTASRGRGPAQTLETSLPAGHHQLKLNVPEGDGTEVRVSAKASIPLPGEATPLTLTAQHWCAIGTTVEELAAYPGGIRDLPADKLYWAILAAAAPALIQSQHGDGCFGRLGSPSWIQLWNQMCVYVPALLYKTNRPDNPYFGNKRFLDAAVMGMEYALRPEIRMQEYAYPDNCPEAFLVTYDLLKDDIEPERRAYWAEELEHRSEGVMSVYLRTIERKYAFYSVDCETSTNQMAYHTASAYLAGKLFNRQDMMDLSSMLMRRLAQHGRPGYFEEQTGSPVNHYTWMTSNALGQYYHWSGDKEVLPTLQACAQYMTAITTASGYTMALHDSRNSGHRNIGCGEHVLSLTPEGRYAARIIMLNRMGENGAGMEGQRIFRIAEDAVFFQPGQERDPMTANSEYPFDYGIIARRDGFHYGLSTIARGAVYGNFVLDAQNVIEMFGPDGECILNGGNSQSQPEAGNFWRKLDEPDWEGKTVGTSNDYLPTAATVSAVPGGHELGLGYRTFEGNIIVRVLSPTHARVEVFTACDKGPVTFSFFPGDEGDEITAAPDGKSVHFRNVTLRANMPFNTQQDFRLLNPYSMKYQYTHKPARCWLDLNNNERFVVDIEVAPTNGK